MTERDKGFPFSLMDEDTTVLRVARVTAVLLGAALLVLGVVLFEGGMFETILPDWGWLLRAFVGGSSMGAGVGLGVAGWTGEDRIFEKIRAVQDRKRTLPGQGKSQDYGEGSGPKSLP